MWETDTEESWGVGQKTRKVKQEEEHENAWQVEHNASEKSNAAQRNQYLGYKRREEWGVSKRNWQGQEDSVEKGPRDTWGTLTYGQSCTCVSQLLWSQCGGWTGGVRQEAKAPARRPWPWAGRTIRRTWLKAVQVGMQRQKGFWDLFEVWANKFRVGGKEKVLEFLPGFCLGSLVGSNGINKPCLPNDRMGWASEWPVVLAKIVPGSLPEFLEQEP